VELEAAQRFTVFREASTSRTGICAEKGHCDLTVLHPQTDISATFGSGVSLAAGYALDVVSGATPKVFGVDAVSSATRFSDTRHQFRGALTYTRPTADVTAGVSTGWESDYRSSALTVTTRSDILDHQISLGFAYTHNFDDVCDQDNQAAAGRPLDRLALASSQNCFKTIDGPVGQRTVTRRLNIDSLEPSLTWAATPRLLLQVGATAQILDGFQSNPYRQVELGSAARTPQESLPTLRQRFALFGRAAYAFPRTRTAVHAMARLYRDTWAVESITGEVLVNQYLAKFLLFSVRGRVHAQRGASFYRDANGYRLFGPNSQYWTGDRELSPMENLLMGGKFAYIRIPEAGTASFFNEIEGAAKWEALLYRLDSPAAPNADRKLAMIWQFAISARF
jgi:hypothetical protein